jgi:hypothetical protein
MNIDNHPSTSTMYNNFNNAPCHTRDNHTQALDQPQR